MSKLEYNLYDIDGNIIRKAGDGSFTVDETEKLVEDLTKKVQENPDNEVYKVYLSNAKKWLLKLYNDMSEFDLMSRMDVYQQSLEAAKQTALAAKRHQLEEVNKAMEDLKQAYDSESDTTNGSSVEEARERLDKSLELAMDEYIESEEA